MIRKLARTKRSKMWRKSDKLMGSINILSHFRDLARLSELVVYNKMVFKMAITIGVMNIIESS